MRRREFIESLGATCRNWRWSWSFINHEKRWVIFGAWDHRAGADSELIMADGWEIRRGRKNPAYSEGLEYIRHVEDGYALFTFRMERKPNTGGESGPASIRRFDPQISQRKLKRVHGEWLAVRGKFDDLPNEAEISEDLSFPEGARRKVIVNSYERDPSARALCLAYHGYACIGCGLKLEDKYGKLAQHHIHVHHLVKVSEMGDGYRVNPKTDLVPVCPNCHAVIHLREPMLNIQELRNLLSSSVRDQIV